MIINFKINEIKCIEPTENNLFNDSDEVYFVLSGSTSYSIIERPRIDPPGSTDYYRLAQGDAYHGINFWTGSIVAGQFAYFTGMVREQDNGTLDTIGDIIGSAGKAALDIINGKSPLTVAVNALVDISKDLINSISRDSDQTIGAFGVRIYPEGNTLKSQFLNVHAGTVIENQSNNQATLRMRGVNSNYIVRFEVQKLRLPMLIAVHSNKALDVADASMADHANVQQFAPHGRSNQRWYLEYRGMNGGFPTYLYNKNIPVGLPYYAIICEQSGKALDVTNASMNNNANVQQYRPHYGLNQLWAYKPAGNNRATFLSMQSGKALTVANSGVNDGVNVVQYTNSDRNNQKWIIR